MHGHIERILATLCLLFISTRLIWSFVYRLFLSAKDSHSYSDNKAISRTLRCTVLAFISLSSTVASFVGLFFIGTESIGALQIAWNALVLMNITTNVICNTLFYAFATPIYKKLCGLIDFGCFYGLIGFMEALCSQKFLHRCSKTTKLFYWNQ